MITKYRIYTSKVSLENSLCPHCTIKTSKGDPLQSYPVQEREFIISSKGATENTQCLTGRDLFITEKICYKHIFQSWVKEKFADI